MAKQCNVLSIRRWGRYRTMTVQVIKVFSPKDPEQEVNVIGNGYPDTATRTVRPADIIASMSYFFNLMEGIGNVDDIDHLGNRQFVLLVNYCKTNSGSGLLGWSVSCVNGCRSRHRNLDTATVDQYSSGCRKYQRILWFFSVVTVHGPNKPTG